MGWKTPKHEYVVRLDLAAADRVLTHTQIDLLKIDESGAGVFGLYENPRVAAVVLWQVVEPEARTHGCSQVDFLDSLDGEIIERGVDALVQALIDFFPQSKRPALEALRSQVQALQKMASARVEQILKTGRVSQIAESKMRELEEKIEDQLERLQMSDD